MTHLLASWESIYANSAVLRTLIAFAHIAGLVSGGGAAIVADRAALSITRRTESERLAVLAGIRNTHRVVLAGLAVVVVSGALLLAADSGTFFHSWVFWAKMGLLILLLGNGLLVTRAERKASAGLARAWTTIRWTATASLVLWALTTLAGAALANAG
jgi:uncharacterized membrane protein